MRFLVPPTAAVTSCLWEVYGGQGIEGKVQMGGWRMDKYDKWQTAKKEKAVHLPDRSVSPWGTWQYIC
jgi:hypothetical protein